MKLIYLSDNVLELQALKNEVSGSYANSATVVVTLTRDDGTTTVTGQVWPTSMTYLPDSDGTYRCILSNLLTLSLGEKVIAKITADVAGFKRYWEIPLRVWLDREP